MNQTRDRRSDNKTMLVIRVEQESRIVNRRVEGKHAERVAPVSMG